MTILCSFECQDYNSFMFKLYQFYVCSLCSTFIYSYYIKKNVKNMLKLYPLGTKNKIIFFVRIKTLSLIF